MNFYTNVNVLGDNILYRSIENGIPVERRVKYQPTLFIPTNNESAYKTLEDNFVEPIQPGSIGDCREFIERYKGIKNFKVYGNTDYIYQFIGDEYPNEINYDIDKISIAHIDIETTAENGFPQVDNPMEKVIGISIFVGDNKYSLGLGKFSIDGVDCYEFDNEKDLLEKFLEIWKHESPQIVTGWNCKFFDIPYLIQRMNKLIGSSKTLDISPWRKYKERNIESHGKKRTTFVILGVAILDYLDLYKNFTYVTQETYKLDHIAFVELGERKLGYGKYNNIKEFYRNDFQRFMEYNVHDVKLIVMLEEKMKLLELAVVLAYSAKVNYEDVFSQVRTWDAIIYHHLRENNIVVPPKKTAIKETQYIGAYVKEPITGMHDWIVSYDVASLYPNIIRLLNLSPETKIWGERNLQINIENILHENAEVVQVLKDYKNNNVCVASNGISFDRSKKGFLPDIIERLYNERIIYKKKMIECQTQLEKDPDNKKIQYEISKYFRFQLCRKIQLNSMYGSLGNPYGRYYDTDLAEAITTTGQLIIRWVVKNINEFLNKTIGTTDYDYCPGGDTDSCYLRLSKLVDKYVPDKTKKEQIEFLDKISKEIILPFIDKKIKELSYTLNALNPESIVMEREVIADKGFWTAKKRYALNVWDSEGVQYESPKLKIMGIETARSSTPAIVREKLKEAISIILTKDEQTVQEFVIEVKEEFFKQTAEDIAFPRSVSNLEKYKSTSQIYTTGTPIAVKGSLIYNYYVEKNNLSYKYEEIQQGDKIKFIYLKEPNPIGGGRGDKVISFPSKIPEELDLIRFVDYEKQFVKSFLSPLETILNAIGWKSKEEVTLESLFV